MSWLRIMGAGARGKKVPGVGAGGRVAVVDAQSTPERRVDGVLSGLGGRVPIWWTRRPKVERSEQGG